MHSAAAEREYTANCDACFGLCCVALAFARSADFAFDKAAGEPCPNLEQDFRCAIHPRLRQQGFTGCTVFDCFGAGQRVSQELFGGRSWSAEPDSRDLMFATFARVRRIHELLSYLDEAERRTRSAPLRDELRAASFELDALASQAPADLAVLDLDPFHERAASLLRRASALIRRAPARDAHRTTRPDARIRPDADLLGASLAGRDLRGADLRGTLLIAADLTGADLRLADVIGADLRDARLHGADLSTALFVTQLQLNAACGSAATRIPARLKRPSHWSADAAG